MYSSKNEKCSNQENRWFQKKLTDKDVPSKQVVIFLSCILFLKKDYNNLKSYCELKLIKS